MRHRKILREDDGPICILKINRPGRLNALDYETIDAMQSELDDIAADGSLRVVILTGSGDRAFSAGADIFGLASTLEEGAEVAVREFVERGQGLTRRIESFPKPIIVAVNGLAYGAGCEIAEAAPLTIASEDATFAKPEINLGFAPPFGGTQRLPRLVGRKRALAMILTTQPISAVDAERIGLVNQVVSREQLGQEARRLALTIAEKDPRAVASCLSAVTRGLNVAIDEGLAIEAGHFARMAATSEVGREVRRFVEHHSRPAR